jgi:hypothetical protein
MLLHTLQFSRSQGPELARNPVVASGDFDQRAAFDQQDLRVNYGFGGASMYPTNFETKYVTGKIEGIDLATSIIEDLVATNRATNNLINLIGGLGFGVDLDVLKKRN